MSKKIVAKLKECYSKAKAENKNVKFLCIGDDSIIGCSVGPKVGTILKAYNIQNVFGCTNEILDFNKAQELITENDFIIIVQSGVDSTGIKVGEVFFKNKPYIGDVAILGVTMNYLTDITVTLVKEDMVSDVVSKVAACIIQSQSEEVYYESNL